MPNLDSSFLIDLLAGRAGAAACAEALERAGRVAFVTSPAVSEVYVGAHRAGGEYLESAESLLERLPILPFDRESVKIAGRIGALLLERGTPIGQADLFIAAITMRHQETLVTGDAAFARVPGLKLENY